MTGLQQTARQSRELSRDVPFEINKAEEMDRSFVLLHTRVYEQKPLDTMLLAALTYFWQSLQGVT